jgi:hypothetical protein
LKDRSLNYEFQESNIFEDIHNIEIETNTEIGIMLEKKEEEIDEKFGKELVELKIMIKLLVRKTKICNN